mmetsp:Transcript_76843/g.207320  ORF Transcript_76843/g.207320 Transcript_76843/m.207320 type:complete len:202 (-) Transcript_76843:4516-5121(-)
MGCHLPWVHATGQAGPWCLGSRPRGLPAAARVFRAHPCRRRFRGGRRRGSARPTPPVRFPPVGTLQAQPASALRRRPWAAIHTRGVHPCPPRPEPPSLHHQLAWAASLSWHWEALRRRQVKRWARADSLAMQGLHHSLASVQQHLAGLECCRLLLDLFKVGDGIKYFKIWRTETMSCMRIGDCFFFLDLLHLIGLNYDLCQ